MNGCTFCIPGARVFNYIDLICTYVFLVCCLTLRFCDKSFTDKSKGIYSLSFIINIELLKSWWLEFDGDSLDVNAQYFIGSSSVSVCGAELSQNSCHLLLQCVKT